ncbi:DUF1214 domain-containing protein [Neorhizobium sp. T786]|uniref:DUF1214 domain-containing protein n=1 Tax=Pseudorhizobium xiangyangii TaxID=2883104 RepID=UPI001CFF9D57|nr:DUF1214 domain-containing protein [Neorhizobium xiangyangii]MCB5202782.1 DUF1214 domain-containing protein [Neorhizobium xiangyangii]
MFRVPFLVAIALAIAFGGGIWSTLRALEATTGFGAIRLGPWEAFPNAQTAEADPYAKSHRASAGALLYASAEGLQFTATVDSAGATLRGDCTYRISGHTPPARLWTLYTDGAAASSRVRGQDLPVALNSRSILRKADGTFDIEISAEAKPANWLAIRPDGRFRLKLTLLDTPAAGSSGLIDLSMPSIQKTGCGDA